MIEPEPIRLDQSAYEIVSKYTSTGRTPTDVVSEALKMFDTISERLAHDKTVYVDNGDFFEALYAPAFLAEAPTADQ